MVFDLHFKNRIEKKKKTNSKTKKDPVKMWKIYTALNSDFKKIYDYDAYKKSNDRVNMFLAEETVIVVSVGVLNSRTLLMKCLMKIYVGIVNFSYDNF